MEVPEQTPRSPPGDFFLDGQFETFARPDMFPALTRLSLSTDEMTQVSSSRAEMGLPPLSYEGLAAQLRRSKFPCLTHLSLTGYELPDNAMIALAEMANRTGIRELDLRYTHVSDEARACICDQLGDRA